MAYRRTAASIRSRELPNVLVNNASLGDIMVKHVMVPDFGIERSMAFSMAHTVFILLSLCLQHLIVYRAVWWIPEMHTSYLNYHLIDRSVFAFCAAMLLAPPVTSNLRSVFLRFSHFTIQSSEQDKRPQSQTASKLSNLMLLTANAVILIVKLTFLALFFGLLAFLFLTICANYSVSLQLCTAYPFLIYVVLFEYDLRKWKERLTRVANVIGPFVLPPTTDAPPPPISPLAIPPPSTGETTSDLTSASMQSRPEAATNGQDAISTFGRSEELPRSGASASSDARLRHRCTTSPRAIRDEVRLFATDFNERLKAALFEATYSCYYAAALPLAFANSAAHFDVTFCVQHVLLVWCAALVYAAARRFPLAYLIELHRVANHLGTWTPLEAANNKSEKPFYMWSEMQLWPSNCLVKHVRGLFRAEGEYYVAAEPGSSVHLRFYFLFSSPLFVPKCILAMLSLIIMYKFLWLLTRGVSEWYEVFSFTAMIFGELFLLFSVTRNYCLLQKCYSDFRTSSTSRSKYD